MFKFDWGWLEAGQEKNIITFDYPLRQIAVDHFLPLLQTILPIDNSVDDFDAPPQDRYHYLQWLQTGKRHYPSYYQRLLSTVACACFGGCMAINPHTREARVEWWDSWRFWESLAAGCVAFHVDFDKYGVNLPVKPENWRHYIGIDLDNPQAAVDRIASEPEILERISVEGRQWALENYSPVPTALRFLEVITAYQNQKEEHFNPQITLPLRKINLIVFPNWNQPEERVYLELASIIKAITTHPNRSEITLLVDHQPISDEDADLALSSIMMNLLMEEELELDDSVEIALIGQLNSTQWSALRSRLQGRIVLEHENYEAIANLNAETIPVYDLGKNNT